MKIIKLSIMVILAVILLSGCKVKNAGVEIVPNLESIYLSSNQVDSIPKLINMNKQTIKKQLVEALTSLAKKNPNYPFIYKIGVRFFINENGRVDKIENIGSRISYNGSSTTIQDQDKTQNLMKIIASNVSGWKYNPASKNGKPVKSWEDEEFYCTINSNGISSVTFGNYSNATPNINEFVPVEKEPQVVKAVQPVYPELAKRAGVEGKVYVKILVDTSGIPLKAVVIKSSDKIFNQVSIDAVMKFKFSSALKDNKPVAVWVVIPFKYTLDGSKGELKQHKELKKMPAPKDSN